jgi:putative chitinase
MEKKLKSLLKTIKLNESTLSLLFGAVTVILIGILVFRMYKSNTPEITKEAEQTEVKTEQVGDVKVEVKEDGKKYPTELPEKYTVEKGDYLWKIAEKFYGSGYNWTEIAKANNLNNPGSLAAGQELKLPKVAVITVEKTVTVASAPKAESISGDSYTVVKGDHLWGIAVRAYGDGYKWTEIAKANNITHPSYIEVGDVLKLPR